MQFDDWGLNKVLCYNLNSLGNYDETKAGLDYSYDTRGVKGRNIAFKLSNTSRLQTYYFCVYAPLSSINLSILLKSEGSYYNDINLDNLFLGFLFGFLILLVVISHGVFWGTRDKAYLFFSINVLVMCVWIADAIGLINIVFGTSVQVFTHYNLTWMLTIIGITGTYFTMYYLDTKNHFKFIHRVYIFTILTIIFLNFILLFCSFSVMILTLSIWGLAINVINFMAAAYVSYKKRYRYFYIYLFSQIILLLGVTVLVLCTFGLVPNNFITHYSYYVCVALQFTIIGYGLVSKINKSKVELENIVEDRTHELHELLINLQNTQGELLESKVDLKNLLDKVYTLLDNSGEGFLSFGNDFIIDSEYSRECEVIFGRNISDENILKLLAQNNEDNYNTYVFNMNMIFGTEDEYRRDVLISILPQTLDINSKTIKIKYKYIENSKIMMVLTDITHESELEALVKEEQIRLKLIVSSIVNRSDFFEIIESCKRFRLATLPKILKKDVSASEKLAEAYRFVHTLKGTSSQVNFIYLPRTLHELETKLTDLNNDIISNPSILINIFEESDYSKALNRDIKIITDTLGIDFIDEKNKIYLDRDQMKKLERLSEIFVKYSNTDDLLLSEAYGIVKTLQYINVKKMLDIYPKYIIQLAEKLDKIIYPFEIEGKDFKIDPEKYAPFMKSLIHVFRNAIDHGIETPDERLESGKDESGKISCFVEKAEDKILITIEDDGRGIDFNRLKNSALCKNIISPEAAPTLTEKALIDLIFLDDFSTKDRVTDISGRGFGLSATKKELDKIGGTVEVFTRLGKGTKFIFKL